jgi:hypothetical protein
MSPLAKPAVCIVGDRVAVFLGSDYKLLDLAAARQMTRLLQRHEALLRRKLKQQKRALR